MLKSNINISTFVAYVGTHQQPLHPPSQPLILSIMATFKSLF